MLHVGFLAVQVPSRCLVLDLAAAGVLYALLVCIFGGSPLIVFAPRADLIAPRGWGMPFWLPLVHAGARVGGTREEQQAQFEMGFVQV
jgi:hypothetical protein